MLPHPSVAPPAVAHSPLPWRPAQPSRPCSLRRRPRTPRRGAKTQDAKTQNSLSARAATGRSCPPDGLALGYSDALDKLTVGGATLGGLSDIAYDSRAHAYVSSVDNDGTNPSRLWFYRNLELAARGPRAAGVAAGRRHRLHRR